MGFVEPVEENVKGDFNVCSVKPDIRSALLEIAHTKGFFDFDSDDNPTANSRRAWLEKTKEGSLQHLSNRWLSKKEDIAVIHLGNWSSSSTDNYIEAEYPDFLKYLHDAKLLRCLSLNGICGITQLPDSISKLALLNILDLKYCRDLEKLPKEIGMLRKLTHLDISGCYLLDEMPKELASLSELRVLKGFIIFSSRKGTKQCTLGDLVKLGKLRKLSLYADKETTGENGELNYLSEFRYLRILAISWIAPCPDPQSEPIKKLIDTSVVSPSLPSGLEKLDLRCWPLSTMPSWIKPSELNSLKKLYIRGGKLSRMQIIQVEGSKSQWMVKILRLKFLRELSMDWEEVGTLFPNLVYFEKVDCPQLSSFPFQVVWRV
ncbi:disease resistance RPP13-like protein 4 [Rhododendron vialii]|uniref:disease resistance RPP13-like protein 4 n=1 Tax=Rhododendron vialii TaxID=182163 RepID=UPI00265E41A5|nr:disease resistance RPP13-like protein 4 [Rhododendron vialii]